MYGQRTFAKLAFTLTPICGSRMRFTTHISLSNCYIYHLFDGVIDCLDPPAASIVNEVLHTVLELDHVLKGKSFPMTPLCEATPSGHLQNPKSIPEKMVLTSLHWSEFDQHPGLWLRGTHKVIATMPIVTPRAALIYA